MTLTQNGIDYICQNFGDANLCCVNTGLSWYYTASGTNYNETGGTAQIVSRLASGLVDSVTMTTPARGSFTQTQLNTANGQTVTIPDCQIIAQHDTVAEGQWCFNAPPSCATYGQADCISHGCHWWNNTCHDTVPTCTQLNNETDCTANGCYWYDGMCHTTGPPPGTCESRTTQADCEANGCYWYNNSCHTSPYQEPGEIPWLPIAIVGAGAIIAIALLAGRKKKG